MATWQKVGFGFWAAKLPNGWIATVSECIGGGAFTAGASGPHFEGRGDGVRRSFEDAKQKALEFADWAE